MPRRLLVALGLSICVYAGQAAAQVASVPDAVITSATSLSPAQIAQVQQVVDQDLAELISDNPETASAARNRILAPLEKPGIGVPFRLAYSNQLCPQLERLAVGENEVVAMNALRILGELATDRSTNTIEPAIDHAGSDVRYTAVYSVGRVFDAVATESPAVAPARVRALIDRLAELIRNETEPTILDVAVRAMITAGSIDKDNFQDIRAHAYTQLSQAASDRVRTLPMEEDGVDRLTFMLRASVAIRDAINDARSLSPEAAKAGSAFGGDVLTFAAARVQRGDISAEERELLNALSRNSQANNYFAASVVDAGVTLATPTQLPDLTPDGGDVARNDDAFLRAAVEEVDRLYVRPFNFERGRFNRP